MEDDVPLDVLVSWLAGRFFFLYWILLCFFFFYSWAITLHCPSYNFLDFSPPTARITLLNR